MINIIEEDIDCSRDLANKYPDQVNKVDSIMTEAHEDHPWYYNPGMSQEAWQARKEKAKQLNQLRESTFANGIQEAPWK